MKETQSEKATYCRIQPYDILEKANMATVKDPQLPGAQEREQAGSTEGLGGQPRIPCMILQQWMHVSRHFLINPENAQQQASTVTKPKTPGDNNVPMWSSSC